MLWFSDKQFEVAKKTVYSFNVCFCHTFSDANLGEKFDTFVEWWI